MTVERAMHSKVRLRVDDFDLLALNGGLEGLERTELLNGDIHLMSPQYSPHSNAKSLFYDALLDWQRAHRAEWAVRMETSVAMPPYDEPIPDVILCNLPTGTKGIPVEEVHLLIEVADESRARDLGYKKALYAQQGVPEYWVVDLVKGKVVQFSKPGADGWGVEAERGFGGRVEAATLTGLGVETKGLG
ncbi:MAG: Uma2 family endonuclease [Novosphingobium sp.]